MKNKIILLFTLVFCLTISTCFAAIDQSTKFTPTSLQITFNSIVLINDKNQEFPLINSPAAGVSGVIPISNSIPVGTYTKMRMTLAPTVSCIISQDGYHTKQDGNSAYPGGFVIVNDASAIGRQTVSLSETVLELSFTPVTISENNSASINVKLNYDNVLEFEDAGAFSVNVLSLMAMPKLEMN